MFDVESNFRYHGNKGHSLANFSDAIKFFALKDPLFGKGFSTISLYKLSYSQFSVNIPKCSLPWQQRSVCGKFQCHP